MNKQFERYLKGTLLLLDLVALNVCYYVSQFLFAKSYGEQSIRSYILFFLISNGIWFIVAFLIGLYNERGIRYFPLFLKKTLQSFFLWALILLFYLFFSREMILSRLFIFYGISCFGLAILFSRFVYLGLFRYYRSSEGFTRKVLVLGYNERAQRLSRFLEESEQNISLIGYTENEENIRELSNYPVIGSVDATVELAKKFDVREIYCTISPTDNNTIHTLMNAAERECIRFKLVPDLNYFHSYGTHVEFYGNIPVLSRRNSAMDDMGNIIKKRLLDIIVSGLVIVFVLSWLVPLLGLLIVLESGFPVFFKQKRTGITNQPFWCLKFRSMKKNREADARQATADDHRVTGIGRFMRRTSLDEFPQFINVFKGNMSLVGPRPHMLKHTDDYSKIVDEFMVRQFVKPGITGWAQIHGFRGEVRNEADIRQRVEKDLWYIENWTLWLDIQILFMTAYRVIKGDKNAY